MKYKRVLLKLSGEALMGGKNFGHDIEFIRSVVEDIKSAIDNGIQVCLVVGGGNICRGVEASTSGMERVSADYIGMLGTVINAIAIQSVMESFKMQTRVCSALSMSTICETYIRRKAQRHMEKGRVVIFAAGTGNPFFTTDSAAVLRAIEMNCDLLLKGTQVDGVYDSDPKKNPSAKRYHEVTYDEVISKNLAVMDMSAFALARENNLEIKVFSIKEKGNFLKALKNEGDYTKITTK